MHQSRVIMKQASPAMTEFTHCEPCQQYKLIINHSIHVCSKSVLSFFFLSPVTEETGKCKSSKQMPHLLQQQWKIHNVTGNLQASKHVSCWFSVFLLLSSDFSVCTYTCTLRVTNVAHFDHCQQLLRPNGLSVVWTNTCVYASWRLTLVALAVMLAVTCSDLCRH